ncbi:YtxH domain-containing protein [Pedobacter frigoris]|uniref:YtxH domain-containing protein n=1 Tax=Pedobacter frigoris TaxID=2571272 RepID=UPI00145E5E45|nr:YtxH domain-containing protein [Pedobacter frigoris]
MKTKKIFESILTPASSGRTTAITLLIGGLAVGAAIGVLFTTKKGKEVRQKICDSFSSLFDHQQTNECSEPASHPKENHARKRPKSDIKNIIHNAHAAAAHTEHSPG